MRLYPWTALIFSGAFLVGSLALIYYYPHPSFSGTSQKPQCDVSLWNHVYAGDPRRFSKPQDRLQIIKDCVTVTGTIINAVAEADGDWHIRLDVDDKSYLNAKNVSSQSGYLVLEPVCSNPVKQADTIAEHACDNFMQSVFNKKMLGKKVSVTGVWVKDMEHGWLEIHPVTSIINK